MCSFFVIFGTVSYNDFCLRDLQVKTISSRNSAEFVRFGKWSAVLDRLRITFADIHPSLIQTSDEIS